MNEEPINKIVNEESLNPAKKIKSNNMIDATLIGVLVGILIYSISAGNFSYFFGMVILYAIYKLANKNKLKKAEVENPLKDRNLN